MSIFDHVKKKSFNKTISNTPQDENVHDHAPALEGSGRGQQARVTPTNVMQLQRTIGNAAVQRLMVGKGKIQREQFIGSSGRHHMHIDIAQPHYKNGNSKASRIDIGPDGAYKQEKLEEVMDAIKGRLGEPGAQECFDWCQAEARDIMEARRTETGRRKR
jgi:hypothetical protein